jgi:signal transduction histidine kinase
MRSIRLSLLGYFLVLLALALGAMSFLVDEIAGKTLNDKEAKAKDILNEKKDEQIQVERSKLDKQLDSQVGFMAWTAITHFESHRTPHAELFGLMALATALEPAAPVTTAIQTSEFRQGVIIDYLVRQALAKIKFDEDRHPEGDQPEIEYFQIEDEFGHVWRSRSLNDASFVDPPPKLELPAIGRPQWPHVYDDTKLELGSPVRRATMKAPIYRYRPFGRPRQSNPNPPRATLGSPPSFFTVQVASTTTKLDAAIAKIEADYDEKAAELEAASRATLAQLRRQLLVISLATFSACMLGGFGLVWLGLRPLGRLSEAVSRISTKDFRLPLDDRQKLPYELQPIANRLTQTLDMLKRAFAREKQAAADISHELRTPLAALMTTLEVGLKKARSGEEYRELLEDCRMCGQQMSGLVERLLALARLDAGVDTLRTQQVDVVGLAEQCAAVVKPLAEARGLTLRVHRNGPTAMQADPNKLSEVVTNLLHNAIQYNRPNGSVDLTVARENGHLTLEVRDTGIGIGPDARTHIFERFYRADPSRHADGLNAGLGLAIVKGYVDLMGGTISVESAEGVGSTFRVELPIS